MTLLDRVNKISSQLIIPSKDYGLIKYQPWGTQQYLREQIVSGVEDGVHEFTILKCRQVGASTELWVFDLTWLIYHSGLQGAFIAQDEKALLYGIDNLRQMQKSIPSRFTPSLRVDNRNLMSWNKTFDGKHGGSRLIYLHAGKGGGGLGRSRGLSFGHFTELAFWADPDDVHALKASLSKVHPRRCFMWESTANGYNFFKDIWDIARRGTNQRAIFVPWWRHALYTVLEANRAFKVYWDGKLTSDEKIWQRIIMKQWGVTLTPNQWAWFRYTLAEDMHTDELMMHQEYPTLPEHAFQASGKSFIGTATIVRLREGIAQAPMPEFYRYDFGKNIETSRLNTTSEKLCQLRVWEPPQSNTFYVIAADPAFAASADSDNAVVSVWRSERTGLVQVAEFASTDIGPQHFTWVIAHLAGTYPIAHLILEINGPGMAVLEEMQQLQNWGFGSSRQKTIMDILGGIRHYIYRRPDTLGKGGFYHWKTGPSNRSWLFSRLRDQLLRGALTIRSIDLVEELNDVRQDGDSFDAPSHCRDDRVITAGLAVECWTTNVEPIMAFLPVNAGEGLPDLSKITTPEMNELPGIADFFQRLNHPVE